jgi:hypothetical protein
VSIRERERSRRKIKFLCIYGREKSGQIRTDKVNKIEGRKNGFSMVI